jgi:RimJ/RimL family protein N-acetyltransferase
MEQIGFHRLHLDHSTCNHASCRVAHKSGYTLPGGRAHRISAWHCDLFR